MCFHNPPCQYQGPSGFCRERVPPCQKWEREEENGQRDNNHGDLIEEKKCQK
uniref:Uncharacterized protein n=1 Tax=viral metagenome TaxID=1070528 RepID=A0A6M3LJZ7_9ZZZZ